MGNDLNFPIRILGYSTVALFVIVLFAWCIARTNKIRGEWRRWADSLGATVVKLPFLSPNSNQDALSIRIVVQARRWPLTIDTYTEYGSNSHNTYTRLMAPYTPTRPFYFRLLPHGCRDKDESIVQCYQNFKRIFPLSRDEGRVLLRDADKLQDHQRAYYEMEAHGHAIPLGDLAFDSRFSLRTTDPETALQAFAQPAIRRLLEEQTACMLAILPPDYDLRFGNTVPVLGCLHIGILENEEALQSAYDLMIAVMEELSAQGVVAS